jgi:hypothetical protein
LIGIMKLIARLYRAVEAFEGGVDLAQAQMEPGETGWRHVRGAGHRLVRQGESRVARDRLLQVVSARCQILSGSERLEETQPLHILVVGDRIRRGPPYRLAPADGGDAGRQGQRRLDRPRG